MKKAIFILFCIAQVCLFLKLSFGSFNNSPYPNDIEKKAQVIAQQEASNYNFKLKRSKQGRKSSSSQLANVGSVLESEKKTDLDEGGYLQDEFSDEDCLMDEEEQGEVQPEEKRNEKVESKPLPKRRNFSIMGSRRSSKKPERVEKQPTQADSPFIGKSECEKPCDPTPLPVCSSPPPSCEEPSITKPASSGFKLRMNKKHGKKAPVLESSKPTVRWERYPLPKLITVRHVATLNEVEGPPLSSNYSSLAMILAPEYRMGKFLPLVDLRAHRADNTTYMANGGFIGRFIPDGSTDLKAILGGNVYYDYRQSSFGYFNQLGIGLEVLGKHWEFRGNVYVPFGPRRHHKHSEYTGYVGDYYYIEDIYEYISYSFNAEIGWYIEKRPDFFLYLAAGPYYIAGRPCVDKTAGAEIRLRPQYKDIFALDLSYRYDSLFESVWQLEVVVQLPLYKFKNRCEKPCGLSDWQIYQPPERFEVMPIGMRRCYKYNWQD